MELPPDIEVEIANYLRLEFGEDATAPGALQASELRYEGEFILEGIPAHFWWFPCSSQQCWATVEPSGETYCLGMTTTSPRELEHA